MSESFGRQTLQGYDALNRLVRFTDLAVQDTTLDCKEWDNLISVTDPKRVTTACVRDRLGNLLSESSPDGCAVHTFNAVENPIQTNDAM